jgi:hypothetical protein
MLNRVYYTITAISILFWIVSSLIFINKGSFTVVTYQTKNTQSKYVSADLYKNNVFRGEFKSKDNNLGLITFVMEPYKNTRIKKKDVITFRFKEKSKSKWDFQREYRIGLFDSQSHFSFGFPIISDSNDKEYQFELSSTAIDKKNYVKIKSTENFITGYQYPKSEIVSGNLNTVHFLFNKTVGSFSDPEFVIRSIKYLMPFIFFQIIFLVQKSFNSKRSYLRLPEQENISNFLELFISKFVISLKYKFNSRNIFLLGFMLTMLWICIIPFGFKRIQNLLNLLVYILLLVGCVKLVLEERNKQ